MIAMLPFPVTAPRRWSSVYESSDGEPHAGRRYGSADTTREEWWKRNLNLFAGSVFLSVAIMHLIPEAFELWDEAPSNVSRSSGDDVDEADDADAGRRWAC